MMNIEIIKSHRAVAIVLLTLNIISPGLLGIFFYKNELFKELDTTKLLLLAITLSTPFLIAIFFMCSFFYDQLLKVTGMDGDKNGTENNDYNIFLMTGMASSISWIATSIVSFIFYLSSKDISNSSLILTTTFSFIIISGILLTVLILKSRKRK